MLDREEIARSLTGAWELFLDRAGAMRSFDVSVEGFWRSFAAVVFTVPAYVLVALADRETSVTTAVDGAIQSDVSFAIETALGILLDWIALPVILAVLAGTLGIAQRYGAFIVARNWCAVIASVPFGVIGLIVAIGLIGADLGNTLMLAALIVVLRYNYLIARRALEASIGFAVGIVVLDFVVGLSIALGLDALFGA
jgi:hypothetical protein